MSTATVTIPYDEFQAIQNEKRQAEEQVADLKRQVTEAKISASDPHLLALSRAALDVVRYAVASLPPESNMGWPFESLRAVAEEVEHMPDATPDHAELAMTLRTFATECEDHERRRMHRNTVKQRPMREIVATADQDP